MPFIRAMARYNQLQTTIRYIDMNPQRLATKRLKPGYLLVVHDMYSLSIASLGRFCGLKKFYTKCSIRSARSPGSISMTGISIIV